jgi:transposase
MKVCLHREEEPQGQALLVCLSCGHIDNADVNTAKNILVRSKDVERDHTLGQQDATQRPTEAPHLA